MKRILKVFLCVMALTAMMTVSAFAAEASVSSTTDGCDDYAVYG